MNFDNITFKIRKNTSFDYNSEVEVSNINNETLIATCIGRCGGKRYSLQCSLFEFDWIDKNGNILNSNMEYSPYIKVLEDNIVIDEFFEVKYNYVKNIKIK